jgi:AcrR family transcriptional regulator
MSPRRSAVEACQTRAAILDRAVDAASIEGLTGLTIGRLATHLRMSKAGVLGHFGTKEALQLAALGQAIEVFRRTVWQPAADLQPGLPRLAAICDSWIAYLTSDTFPGGCFLTAASCEFDGRPGPVRDAIADALVRWQRRLEREAATAIDGGELPTEASPAQVAFELNAVAMGVNQSLQLHRDTASPYLAHIAMRRILSLAPDEPAGEPASPELAP